jgi:hypothetical protein
MMGRIWRWLAAIVIHARRLPPSHWSAWSWRVSREELEAPLAESVKAQSHCANLLNGYDGGRRTIFADAAAWLERLRACRRRQAAEMVFPARAPHVDPRARVVITRRGTRALERRGNGLDAGVNGRLLAEIHEGCTESVPRGGNWHARGYVTAGELLHGEAGPLDPAELTLEMRILAVWGYAIVRPPAE